MSAQRKPLVGWTYDPEPMPGTFGTLAEYYIYNAAGDPRGFLTAKELGIPLPPEPRTGRLGLNEADTRKAATEKDLIGDGLTASTFNAALAMCREDVAEWDAQPEPDTLTVTLPMAMVRAAVELWGGQMNLAGDFAGACRAALDAAGLA